MQVHFGKLFSSLNQVFPFYSILLIFYPYLLGLFFEPSLFNPRDLVINFVWISILTIPIVLSRSTFHHRVVTCLFFLIGIMETTHWILLNSPITITSLLVLSNTYAQEVKEFSSVITSPRFLIVLPIFFIFFKALKNSPKKKDKVDSKIFVWLIASFSVLFITETAIHGRLIRKGVPNIAKTTFSFLEKIQLFKQALKDHKPRELSEVKTENPQKKQTTVVILGESNNRQHMSIYGAKENTSPKLLKRNDIVIYNDIVSPYSTTIQSVLTIFSQTNLEKEVDILNNIDILDVFHSAKFKNYWISNQCPIGIWDNQITEFSKKSDHNEFVNMTANSSFEATYTPSYDEKLIAPLKKILKEPFKKKLIVLHMIGNHMSYNKRYPSDFNKFKGNGSNQSNTKSEYKNSLLYTDFIVDSIFSLLEEQTKIDSNHIISAVYLSDHGENVYDYKNQLGHGCSNPVPKVNVEIPFIIWLSEAYKSNFKEKISHIESNKNLPYVTDDLFHGLIDLSGIKTNYLDTTRSIFNQGFNHKRKRILCDGNDYDLR